KPQALPSGGHPLPAKGTAKAAEFHDRRAFRRGTRAGIRIARRHGGAAARVESLRQFRLAQESFSPRRDGDREPRRRGGAFDIMRNAEGYVDQLAILRADTDAYFSPAYFYCNCSSLVI